MFNLNQCADGRWLSMGAWTPALTYRALEVMGLVDLLGDERSMDQYLGASDPVGVSGQLASNDDMGGNDAAEVLRRIAAMQQQHEDIAQAA